MPQAATIWKTALESWAIPQEILDAAPESPWALPSHLFVRKAETIEDTPSRTAALRALPDRGTVLDVGCGAGAASLTLAERDPIVTGVDDSDEMLRAFRTLADAAGIDARAVKGRWPDVAGTVEKHDVVVCHHVVYNVADIEPFLTELHAHARRRVVVEMTAEHPRAALNPLWRTFWGLDRPTRPTAADLEAVVRELGYPAHTERFETTSNWTGVDEMIPWVRRWLCLPPDRDDDVRAALADSPPPLQRHVVTLWWDRA